AESSQTNTNNQNNTYLHKIESTPRILKDNLILPSDICNPINNPEFWQNVLTIK
ncbi:6552_t:CDS:1, partial [Ambispora leptoticha]